MPTKVAVYDQSGKIVDDMELNGKIFGIPLLKGAIHDVVVMQLANRRAGTAKTKARAEISGSTKKPWRQKGTGRARAGSGKSPVWRGGGRCFGPVVRDYSYSVPRKVKMRALQSVLTARLTEDNLRVVNNLELEQPKTKKLVEIIENLNLKEKVLIVTTDAGDHLKKASRNIKGVTMTTADNLNVYQVVSHDKMVVTRDAMVKLERRFSQ